MFEILKQKKRVSLLIVILLTCSVLGVYAQNADYEERLKQAEQVAQQLVKPNVAVFDLHNNTDLKKITIELIKVAKDPKIQGILLWIDCNGGYSGLITSIHDTLLRIKKLKPIVALVRGNAYSGAYHIAVAAHYIFAHGESEVGSIGVKYEIYRYKNTKVKQNGIEADLDVTLFTAGKYKGVTSVYGKELTEEDKREIQRGVDAINRRFIADVAQARNLDISTADQWADAKTFIAHEAVELGLIDEAEAKMVELIRDKNPDKLVKGDVEYIFFDCVAPAPAPSK